MYQLVSAIGRPITSDGRWESIDIGNLPMYKIYTDYYKVIATLSNPFLPDPVALNLKDVQDDAGGLTITFNEFLTQTGNNSLPTSTTLPQIKTKFAEYNDVFRAGYNVQPVHPTASPDADVPYDDKTWLFLSQQGVDFNEFRKYCMVTVNGFFHWVDANSQGAWVQDGMKSLHVSNYNVMGITSFANIGEIEYKRITPQMVYKQVAGQEYKHRTYVNIGEDISNKTVMLVLGGYLHVLDQRSMYRVGEQQIAINMENIPLLKRFHESSKYLDLSSLPIHLPATNPSQAALDEFYSDENIIAYLTLPQSFLVLVNNTDIFVERVSLAPCISPKHLHSYIEPKWPVINGCGKVVDYWPVEEEGQWGLCCIDTLTHQRQYITMDAKNGISLGDSRIPEEPVRFSQGYFLKIGTDLSA